MSWMPPESSSVKVRIGRRRFESIWSPTAGITLRRCERVCSIDMNSVNSARLKAQVSTTCWPCVLMTLTRCPALTKAALPLRAGMVIWGIVPPSLLLSSILAIALSKESGRILLDRLHLICPRHQLGDAAARPIELRHLFDGAALRRFEARRGVGIVEGERLAVPHHLSPVDEDLTHGALARGVDEAADRIVKRPHRRMRHIDEDEIGLGAGSEAADILAPQRLGAADRRRVEEVGRAQRMGAAGADARRIGGVSHLFEEIVREGIGAEAEIDAGALIGAEILQRDAAPREDGRAMGDARAGRGEAAEIVAARPMEPGMMVEEDAVADDGAGAERAQGVQPFDRRLTVAAHDLLEFDDALRRMDLEGKAPLARGRRRIGDELGRAGVDLRRADEAREAARGVLARPFDKAERALHGGTPRRLVPFVVDGMAVTGEPAGGAEHRRRIGADAAFAERVEPALMLDRKVAERGDAARHQLRQGHLVGGAFARGVALEEEEVLVKRAHIELGAADFVGEALQHRLGRGMGVDVDEAGHDEKTAPVDLARGGVAARRADMRDAVAGEFDIDAAAIDMPPRATVPGDD